MGAKKKQKSKVNSVDQVVEAVLTFAHNRIGSLKERADRAEAKMRLNSAFWAIYAEEKALAEDDMRGDTRGDT